MIQIFLVLLIIGGASLYVLAPHPPATPKQVKGLTELEAYLNLLVKSGSPPGLSMVVVKEGKIVYNNAFGYADQPRNIKATPNTVYHWWSMTKIPTAVAIMQLQEQGKVDIDEPVKKYLPWFDVIYPSAQDPVITIRNLLQHISGLPDTIPAMVGWVYYDDETPNQTEIVKRQLPKFNKLKFKPGSKAVYSNLNYMVLGAVIESVSGQSYRAYIIQNILQPLDMSHTDFVYTPEMANYEAAGTLPISHVYTALLPTILDPRELIRERQGKFLWLNRVYIDATPSTGLIGSAPDMARLIIAYLNLGSLDGKSILSPESISLLTNTKPIDGHGLGWFVYESKNEHYLEHAGGGPGFATTMRLYPDTGLGIAILSNGTDLDREGLVDLFSQLEW